MKKADKEVDKMLSFLTGANDCIIHSCQNTNCQF